METTVCKMKNTPNGINIKWDITEEVNKHEGGAVEIIHNETYTEKK